MGAETTHVRDAVRALKHSPDINRDTHAAKLRDFLALSPDVLDAFLCQGELHELKQSSGKGRRLSWLCGNAKYIAANNANL